MLKLLLGTTLDVTLTRINHHSNGIPAIPKQEHCLMTSTLYIVLKIL